MWSLKAWGQGSGAPAYRQVVQRPTGTSRSERRETDVPDLVRGQFEVFKFKSWERPLPQRVREGLEPGIADLVRAEAQTGQLVQGPSLNRLSESGEACVADLVVSEFKHLLMADQTNVLSQESAPAKSQGMGTRQQGAISPPSGPGPRSQLPHWHTHRRGL